MNQIYAPDRDKLNDPYDCRFDFTELIRSRDVLDYLLERYSTAPNFSVLLRKMGIVDQNGEWLSFGQTRRDSLVSRAAELLPRYGIISLNALVPTDQQSMLLWSHYGDGHKGFAIEIEFEQGRQWNELRRVEYVDSLQDPSLIDSLFAYHGTFSNERPTADEGDDYAASIVLDRFLSIKSKHWRHEKEWRMVTKECNRLIDLPAGVRIKKIFFGANCDDADIETIRAMTKERPGLDYMQCRLNRRSFELSAVPINSIE